MVERKYSVAEIDRMRRALERICTPTNRGYFPAEVEKRVEERLRTYMQNGTDPEELEAALYAHVGATP